MATPFDVGVQVLDTVEEPMTLRQRRTIRTMALEKAELIGLDLQQADDRLDTWLGELSHSKVRASNAIRTLARQLDEIRAERGITR